MSEPPATGPLRVAFLGQSTYFRATSALEDTDEVTTAFVEFREYADPAGVRPSLEAFAPDVVVAYRPEILPPGLLAERDFVVVGFLTEPIPRVPGGRAHPDLAKRARDLRKLDPANVDRIVSFDPLIVPVAEEVFPVWRSLPLPVADRMYHPLRPPPDEPRLIFVGRSTAHRERFLGPVKREFDLMHAAFGAGVEELTDLLGAHNTSINLHNEPYPSFENRVSIALASSHVVITEPLSPLNGLEPGVDHLQIQTPDELMDRLHELAADPARFQPLRARGREKAELFRASTVYARLARDALADVAAAAA